MASPRSALPFLLGALLAACGETLGSADAGTDGAVVQPPADAASGPDRATSRTVVDAAAPADAGLHPDAAERAYVLTDRSDLIDRRGTITADISIIDVNGDRVPDVVRSAYDVGTARFVHAELPGEALGGAYGIVLGDVDRD